MDTQDLHTIILSIINSEYLPLTVNSATLPSEKDLGLLIDHFKLIIAEEPTMIRIKGPVSVVGDIHGNLSALLGVFESQKYPPESKFVFLGDYVDRGAQSIHCLILLFSLKILYPGSIYLLRGNHETEFLTSYYNFRSDCLNMYSKEIYDKFIDCFRHLSLVALINDSHFCVHGCIGPELVSLSQINEISKPIPDTSIKLAEELMWSDPDPDNKMDEFSPNSRGAGYFAPKSQIKSFLDKNGLKMIIRSHEFKPNGYEYTFGEDFGFLTVFSSGDYCGMFNSGAIAYINTDNDVQIESLFNISVFSMKIWKPTLPVWLMESTSPSFAQYDPITEQIVEETLSKLLAE